MICFHSLNYWYLQQQLHFLSGPVERCDLLSFFELLIFTTTPYQVRRCLKKLWFAFILWTTDIYNNYLSCPKLSKKVVICFHSLNYWYLQQLQACPRIFYPLLWFAFILWTTDIYNNVWWCYHSSVFVVICFHSLNYWYLQQLIMGLAYACSCCDLLSFFELLIFTTTALRKLCKSVMLWFAFILWTTDIYNNQLENLKWVAMLWFAFILWTTDIYNNLKD